MDPTEEMEKAKALLEETDNIIEERRKRKQYDHPSSGDLEHLKFLFNAPERPDFLWEFPSAYHKVKDYIEWLEWQLDSQAAHNRISSDNYGYLRAKCEALEEQLRKMTRRDVDGESNGTA